MGDHYPWNATPLVAPGTPVLGPSRFVKRGDSMICLTCDLDVRYCRGHPVAADVGSANDAAESDLSQRARACRGAR